MCTTWHMVFLNPSTGASCASEPGQEADLEQKIPYLYWTRNARWLYVEGRRWEVGVQWGFRHKRESRRDRIDPPHPQWAAPEPKGCSGAEETAERTLITSVSTLTGTLCPQDREHSVYLPGTLHTKGAKCQNSTFLSAPGLLMGLCEEEQPEAGLTASSFGSRLAM